MGGRVSSTVDVARESFTLRETTIIFINDGIEPSLKASRQEEVSVCMPLHSEGGEIEEVFINGNHTLL